jgi:hypothetical protein
MQGTEFDKMTDRERDLVTRFLGLLRGEQGIDAACGEFFRAWEDWKGKAPNLPEDEVETLVNEAVQYARSR